MNLLALLRRKIAAAIADMTDDPKPLLELVRRSGDPRHGDYQANLAMPLGKQLGKPPREVAQQIVETLLTEQNLADLCEPPEVAGPGFVNFRIKDEVLLQALNAAIKDERLGVAKVADPKTIVIDYSSPNVAKPLHVGHLRSTVIGGALDRTLRFLGHKVISDNHLGDWGTQFGMIIYGYKNFRDDAAYQKNPVDELSRLYRLVNQLVEYQAAAQQLSAVEQEFAKATDQVKKSKAAEAAATDKKEAKSKAKERTRYQKKWDETEAKLGSLRKKISAVEDDETLNSLAKKHANIGQAVLQETAKLHSGDEENVRLWNEFMPHALERLNQAYQRLGISFDHMLGESFYQDMLADVVSDLQDSGIASESEGAVAVFLDGFDTPMLVQKRDGAFLYSTTDLATIRYRMENWKPDVMLYVVDHRQSLHFQQLFAAARKWGVTDVDLRHIAFGTVMGEDGKPYKTRSSSTVGLQGLLDDAVQHAFAVVQENEEEGAEGTAALSEQERLNVSEIVGLGGLKYVDLSHNRDSDYTFSYEKMLNKKGNTATYMQYGFARGRSIFRRGGVNPDEMRKQPDAKIIFTDPHERALALEIIRFEEALNEVTVDYRPNQLTSYLFDQLSKSFSTFFENCPVLKAESEDIRNSRLLLCNLTGRTVKQGLELLGIEVAERM